MEVFDSRRGRPVRVEIRDGLVFVGNARGVMVERTRRFDQTFWDDLKGLLAPEVLAGIDRLRPLTKSEKFNRIFDRYQTYEGPRGNPHQWRQAAEALLGGVATTNEHLVVLGLTEMPPTRRALRKAWLAALKKEHPDIGGSVPVTQLINQAYEILLGRY